MTKLLIVDDMAIFREPIAASLRREGFDTVCASNGNEALDLLCGELPELILLDIAMPVMDGLTCLKVIRGRAELREIPVIMLTALSEREMLTQAIRIGVQGLLLKSQFSLDDLVARVRQALASRSEAPPEPSASPRSNGAIPSSPERPATEEPPTPLTEAETLEQIRREAKLRAVPTILHHVMSMTRSERTSFDDVGSAVQKDHALALKVMKVANSSFFGTGRSVRTLAEAAQRIGMIGIRNATASILAIEHFSSTSTGELVPQHFWQHSLATAALADLIGHAVKIDDAEHLFLAGLLHDVGRLVLSGVFPDHYAWALRAAGERNVNLVVVEREMFGLTHDRVTQELLSLWQTPEDIREAASAHEHPVEQIQRSTRDPRGALVIALANRLAHASVLGDSGNSMLLLLQDHAKALELNGPSLQALVREGVDKVREAELFYASRAEQDFRCPRAEELTKQVEGEIAVKVFANDSPGDPLSLFCEQLGWTAARRPRCAVLFAASSRGLAARFNELLTYEATVGARLRIVIASSDASTEPPGELVEGRHWESVPVPSRYTVLTGAIARLCREPVPESVSAPS